MTRSSRIRVPGRYRRWVRTGLVAVPLVSIAIAAITLPPQLSIPIAVLLVVFSLLLNRFIFVYGALLVMPGPTEEMHQFMIGTCWYADNTETLEGLGIGLVYKYKSAAQHAYHMLHAWNYGKFIDDEGNIKASFVNEGGGRYSVLIYPGPRVQSQVAAEMAALERLGPKSEVDVRRMHFYIHCCLDYSDEEAKQRMVQSLPRVEYLFLNTFFVDGNQLKAFAKRPFRLKRFAYADRSDPNLGQLEQLVSWSDPTENKPQDVLDIVERVRKMLPNLST